MATSRTDCPHKSTCEMYELLSLSGTILYWQMRYCNGAYESCERFRVAARGRPVPLTLLPTGEHLTPNKAAAGRSKG